MPHESVRPKDYFSDSPPERIIGTECEYNLQEGVRDDKRLSVGHYITPEVFKKVGITKIGSFLDNGAKSYSDMNHLEYATPESLGPKEAAKTDRAGVEVVGEVVEASGLPHDGLFRVTGTFFPEKGKPETEGKTSGYHENYMLPRLVTRRQVLDELIPAHLATRIWGLAGTARESFVFSQKVWGIGGRPITRKVERRTEHGFKPMAMIPPNDGDTVGNERWARLEVRYADAGLSPIVRYVGFAAASLILRLVEYENVIDGDMKETGFKHPVDAAKLFGADLTLKKTAELKDGRRVTALDMQRILLGRVLELADRIDLPKSETEAIPAWVSIVDRLSASNPAEGEYNGLEEDLDVAAKHFNLLRHCQKDQINKDDKRTSQITVKWDMVHPKGAGIKWWQHYSPNVLEASELEYFKRNAPATRAAIRAAVIRNNFEGIRSIDWAHIKLDDKLMILNDPYSSVY